LSPVGRRRRHEAVMMAKPPVAVKRLDQRRRRGLLAAVLMVCDIVAGGAFGGSPSTACRYPGAMAAQPVLTGEEWIKSIRDAPPPTPDDVPITRDGQCLITPEEVRAWLEELAAGRAAEDASGSNVGA
jgi:hypothetical protein